MPVSASPDEDSSRRRVQDAVGDGYRVEELLGRGGFAEVFAATDLRLGRRVAVKVLRPDLTVSGDLLERFQREARAVATLRHPNVMPIYSVGERKGVAFFTMPLIEGESLQERLEREEVLGVEEARRIVVETARALAAAHAKGIVHRDVKPDNILLEGEESRVLLADFGIAKAMETDGPTLTGSDLFMGTPRYGSPEQMSGDPLDHRSDLYSLGAVAYRMLAGRPPFEADSTRKLVVKHLTESPEPLRSLRPECPGELAAAVERCLAKEPDDRWVSAKELAEALTAGARGGGAMGAGAGVTTSGPPTTPRGRSPTSGDVETLRKRAVGLSAVSAAIVAVELLLGGTGVLGALALVVSAGMLAVWGGRLWTEGHGWKELLGGGETGSGPTPDRTADEGLRRRGYADIVDDGRRERANIVRLFEAMPRSRRADLPGLVGTVDQLLARLRQRARALASLEDRLEEELAVADRDARLGSAGTDAVGDSGARARLGELEGAREAASRELGSILATLRAIRSELDRVDPVEEELLRTLEAGRVLLRGGGSEPETSPQATDRRA